MTATCASADAAGAAQSELPGGAASAWHVGVTAATPAATTPAPENFNMTTTVIDALDYRALILALQEVTEDLTSHVPTQSRLQDSDEAHALLASLLRATGDEANLPDLGEAAQHAAARRVLGAFAADPATAEVSQAVLADPPSDTRLGAELAIPGMAVLAGLVTWLQLKVDVRVKREDGKTEFEFRLSKDAASSGLLKELAAAVLRLWNGPPPP